MTIYPFVPAKAGTQGRQFAAPAFLALDSRLRGNERSMWSRLRCSSSPRKSANHVLPKKRGPRDTTRSGARHA